MEEETLKLQIFLKLGRNFNVLYSPLVSDKLFLHVPRKLRESQEGMVGTYLTRKYYR